MRLSSGTVFIDPLEWSMYQYGFTFTLTRHCQGCVYSSCGLLLQMNLSTRLERFPCVDGHRVDPSEQQRRPDSERRGSLCVVSRNLLVRPLRVDLDHRGTSSKKQGHPVPERMGWVTVSLWTSCRPLHGSLWTFGLPPFAEDREVRRGRSWSPQVLPWSKRFFWFYYGFRRLVV